MVNMAINMLDSLFQKCVEAYFLPIKGLFGLFTSTPEVMQGFAFIDVLYTRLQVVAAALMILIVLWQSFKTFFAFLGFECEEAWRIGGRAVASGFLIIYSKEIVYVALGFFKCFVDYIWGAYWTTVPSTQQFVTLIFSIIFPSTNITLFSWSAFMLIYLAYKFIVLAFRFGERLMLTALLIMASPLAFASGVSQLTKGFLQGWVKLFAGNLVVQLLQLSIVISMIIYRATDKNLLSPFSFIITVSMIKVLEKLEDIVRDASMNVGIGRDVSSAIQKVQSAIYTGTQTSQVIDGVKSIFKKGGAA
jgi:hypothetical protein